MYDAKFDANKGVFHFVFADQEDDYFDPMYLKLDFQTALWCRVKDAQYKYIIIISHTAEGSGGISIELTGVKESTIANLSEEEQPKDTRSGFVKFFTTPIGSKKPREIRENPASFDAAVSRKRLKVPEDKWDSYLRKLFNFMDDNQRVALALPGDLFVRLGETPERIQALIRRKEQYKLSGNIVVITSPLQITSQTDYISGGIDCILHSGDRTSIFAETKLFKELELSAVRHENDKVVRPYDFLSKQECFGERLVVWDNMTQDDIERAIRYALLRRKDMIPLKSVELCAALFQLLRENALIRARYGKAVGIDAEKMNLKMIRGYITSCDIEALNDVLRQVEEEYKAGSSSTRAPTASALLNMYYFDHNRVPICCGREDIPKVSLLIDQFKDYIDARYGGDLGEARYRQMVEVRRFFRQPMLPSRKNKEPVPYLRLRQGTQEYLLLKELIFDHLEHREECNCWDEGIIQTLLFLFRDLKETCGEREDWFNDKSGSRFQSYLSILDSMRKRSEAFERDKEGWDVDTMKDQGRECSVWIGEMEDASRSEDMVKALKTIADRLQHRGW